MEGSPAGRESAAEHRRLWAAAIDVELLGNPSAGGGEGLALKKEKNKQTGVQGRKRENTQGKKENACSAEQI